MTSCRRRISVGILLCLVIFPSRLPGTTSTLSATESLSITDVNSGNSASHTCALLNDNTIRCWGYNNSGQLGLGDTNSRGDDPNEMSSFLPAVDVGAGIISKVRVNGNFSCVLMTSGRVRCWGANNSGQLGVGNTSNRGDQSNEMGSNLQDIDFGSGRTATDFALGGYHACAILDNGDVKCWGDGGYGQLGTGGTSSVGDGPDEMGDNLVPVDLGTSQPVSQLALGFRHSCARFSDGTVKCWGDTTHGQLGLEENVNDRGDEPNEMGLNLPFVDYGTGLPAVEISAGQNFTCIRSSAESLSRVKCWGYNNWGALGTGDSISYGYAPGSMGSNIPTTGPANQGLSTGSIQTCLLSNGVVTCKGGRYLSDGSPSFSTGAYVWVNTGSVSKVTSGSGHSCALKTSGELVCWGRNSTIGVLGVGHKNFVGETPQTIELFDITPPAVASGGQGVAIEITSAARLNNRYVLGDSIDVTVTFTEAVVVTGSPKMSVTIGGQTRDFDYLNQPTASSVKFRYTVVSGDNGSVLLTANSLSLSGLASIIDPAGNDAVLTHALPFQSASPEVDTTVATVSMGRWSAFQTERAIDVDLVFSEDVSGLTAGDLELSGSANNCTLTVNGATRVWRMSIQCESDGSLLLKLKANSVIDGAGVAAPSTDFSSTEMIIDTVAPSVTWRSVTTPLGSRSTTLTLDVSEAVTGLDAADITNSGTARGCVFSVTQTGLTWVVDVTCTSDGTLIGTLGFESIADSAGNNGPSAAAKSDLVTFDTTPTPPNGGAGISINTGDSYTKNQDVTLSIIWPKGATEMKLSNDGGFSEQKVVTKSVARHTDWKLDTLVAGLHTKIVYVRFVGDDIDGTKTYSDDIVYDAVAPTVSSSKIALADSKLRLSLSVADDVAGVNEVHIRFNGKEIVRKYSSSLEIEKSSLGMGDEDNEIEIRVSDTAGNFSSWFSLGLTSATPSGTPALQSSPTRTGISSKGSTVGVVRAGKTLSAKALTKAAKIKTPPGSKVLLKIAKTSSKRCKLSAMGLKGIAVGRCTVTVTVVAASGKRSSKTVSMRVA
jgi:alpha-tubulin suppressor-like RCC1 family protein